jgi:hypothetical protein
MAPNSQLIRLGELETEVEKLKQQMTAVNKDAHTVTGDVAALTSAVFGDRSDPDRRPGLIADLRQIKATVAEINAALKKLMWMVVGGFVAGLITLVIKH